MTNHDPKTQFVAMVRILTRVPVIPFGVPLHQLWTKQQNSQTTFCYPVPFELSWLRRRLQNVFIC